MSTSLITLTTDFGTASPYVAAMKGVILSTNPRAQIVDLTHAIPPQDVHHAAFFLAAALPFFPPEAIHVVVVDPGVGTDRALLFVEIGTMKILAPDNGCWTILERGTSTKPVVRQLVEERLWRSPVSATFHGRDILGPVAAHLSRGEAAASVGPTVSTWKRLEVPQPNPVVGGCTGEVVFIDGFGNLITNIPGWQMRDRARRLRVGRRLLRRGFAQVRSYGDADAGSLVLLESSAGLLEIAVVNGNAQRELGARIGSPVTVHWSG